MFQKKYKRDDKLQNESNKEAEKISALSPGKTDKYKYLIGKEILTPDQNEMIKKAKVLILLQEKHFQNK